MEKEATKAPMAKEKNKENSKKLFLEAVGKILKTKGYAALGINEIAATAGLNKKLIYRYFGGIEQLLDEYVLAQDFWSNVKGDKVPKAIDDGGQAFLKQMFQTQFDRVYDNRELQKVLLWRLAEERSSLRKLTEEQEHAGEELFEQIVQPHFGESTPTFRAIAAIMVSGLYYLDLYAAHNGSIFCGVDIASADGRQEIKKAMDFLVDQTYDHLKHKGDSE